VDLRVGGLFDRFAPAIASLSVDHPLKRQELLTDTFRLTSEGSLEIFYAPFDYLNPAAKLVLMGITPGWAQMQTAYREAASALWEGATALDACSRAKRVASFAGPMRRHLITMLDGLDVHRALGISSTAWLFDVEWPLLHTTSAIRYPTFVNGENYTGHSPSLLRTPVLRRFVVDVLAPELAMVPSALIVPLGSAASQVVKFVIEAGTLASERCLIGFPHPSGGNGYRVRQYREHRDAMRATVAEWFAASGNRSC
jgi:hypothetical protein